MSIPDIFETHGEPHFRDGEARVIARLLDGGPSVLATGGGAFLREETRDRIRRQAISIWLKADVDTIMRRVKRRADRPLLQTADPAATVERLVGEREPFYQAADLTIWSREVPHEKIVDECIDALHVRLCAWRAPSRTRRHRIHWTPDDDRAAETIPPPITVDVALGDRSYDIVIGRDVLPSLGARIAALRPGARTAIVTDRTVARHWLAEDGSRAGGCRHRDVACHRR